MNKPTLNQPIASQAWGLFTLLPFYRVTISIVQKLLNSGHGKHLPRYRPWIPASSLLLFPCGVALVWFMADSDKRGSDGHVTERSRLGKGE
jgi:hypothetical protein